MQTKAAHTVRKTRIAIDEPRRVEGKLDYRTEWEVSAKVGLKDDGGFPEKASLVFSYQRFFDNVPPRVSLESIPEASRSFIDEARLTAEDTHSRFETTIEFSW